MRRLLFMLTMILLLLAAGCGGQPSSQSGSPQSAPAQNTVEISFTYSHRAGIASNQFAVWIEDGGGKLVKTLFVTRFTAKGGWKNRPEAIPLWVEKSGISEGNTADAHSGATPKSGRLAYIWDCTDESGKAVPAGDYLFVVEGTIFWQDAVTYTGTITIGGGENSKTAEAAYTTEAAKEKEMITDVKAVYKP